MIGLVFIMLMLMTQTVLIWFSVSILWSDEIVSVMNIWLVFMAATVVSHEKAHVQVDFITNMFPRWLQTALSIVMDVLSIVACVFVFKGGVLYIQGTQNITTNILRLPMFVMYIAPLIALALMILMNFTNVCRSVASFFHHPEAENAQAENAEGGNEA